MRPLTRLVGGRLPRGARLLHVACLETPNPAARMFVPSDGAVALIPHDDRDEEEGECLVFFSEFYLRVFTFVFF